MRLRSLWGRGFGGALATTALVVACGGGSGGGGGGGASTSSAFIASFCDVIGSCCPKVDKTYNQQKCVNLYNAIIGEAGTYDPAKGQTCLDALRAAQSQPAFCNDDDDDDDTQSQACEDVFKEAAPAGGTKQPGELCDGEGQCAAQPDGEVECASFSTGQATTRKCQVQVRAKEGDACVGDKEDEDSFVFSGSDDAPRVGVCWRPDGLSCDREKKCAKLVAEGGECGFSFGNNPCVKGAYCKSDTKKCTPVLKRGEACTSSEECGAIGCFNGKCGGESSSGAGLALVCD
ncbi:MAG: hypothetical protein KIT84_12295 [Labilithrix sp.]|nr:hypothetical protein [Labilithrix sp.]MCW5811793.1 hypothetical protein [Labilithrix sp.]